MTFSKDDLVIHFAHQSYPLAERFALRDTGIAHFQTWSAEEAGARFGEAQAMVISGLWRNDLLQGPNKLVYIQGTASGYDFFDLEVLKTADVRLCNARGVNANAVSDHAIGLMLALSRRIHFARDNQREHVWPGYKPIAEREDELAGKTALIFGLGTIGQRLAKLAKAFDMTVIGVKRDHSGVTAALDELHKPEALHDILPRADYVILTCPLTPQTEKVIDRAALAAMKPGACLINVARGRCVEEEALIEALRSGALASAGIDTVEEEPLAANSPLWDFENVIVTPHTAGETRCYEDNVIDILLENIDRLARGESPLRNQIV